MVGRPEAADRLRAAVAATVVGVVAGAWVVLTAGPASAACHIAAFVESEVEASESTGVVSLVVELQGRVGSCAGTVDVATVDGEAIAGEDYEAVTRTLTFEEDDDRVETVDITILADDVADAGETFTVELSNPTGSISGTGGPATVTIVDGTGDADAGTTDGATDDGATDDGATDPGATADGAVDGDEDDGLDVGILLAVVGAIAVGVAAIVLLRGRAR